LEYCRAAQTLLGVVRPTTSSTESNDSDDRGQVNTTSDKACTAQWLSHYPLTLHLSSERGDLEYLCGHVQEADDELSFALSQVTDLSDRVRLYQQLLAIYSSASRFVDAIHLSRRALDELGQPLPLNPDEMTDEQKVKAASLPITTPTYAICRVHPSWLM
jgi:hypothetical protein